MTGVDLNRDSVRLAHFENARVSPDLATLLQGDKKQARFQARLAEGTIQGRAVMQGYRPIRTTCSVEADLSQIRIDKIDAIKVSDLSPFPVFSRGRMTHDAGRSPAGTTNGLLTVSGLHIA
jgi:hypothetical protein